MHRAASLVLPVLLASSAFAADENDYWTIRTLPEPEGVHLEVGGILPLGAGEIMACTRRGEVWIIENAMDPQQTIAVLAGSPADVEHADDPHRVRYHLHADGLQEPLGLATTPTDTEARLAAIAAGERWNGPVFVSQRGEISKMTDLDGDRHADRLETVCDD